MTRHLRVFFLPWLASSCPSSLTPPPPPPPPATASSPPPEPPATRHHPMTPPTLNIGQAHWRRPRPCPLPASSTGGFAPRHPQPAHAPLPAHVNHSSSLVSSAPPASPNRLSPAAHSAAPPPPCSLLFNPPPPPCRVARTLTTVGSFLSGLGMGHGHGRVGVVGRMEEGDMGHAVAL